MSEFYFSNTYTEARYRFRKAAAAVGAVVSSYAVATQGQDKLTIDVAIVGPKTSPTIVLSSGVHGVEGFFGSAVQLAFLQQLKNIKATLNVRYVLIHAVNPFGFASLRRCNEENIDLNRNFLQEGAFHGVPDAYARLHPFLNPSTPPSSLEPFKLKALWNIFRHGLQPLKQALAGGQYEYPQGIFFGGDQPSPEAKIIYKHSDSWIGKSEQVVHIDWHSGLGGFASYKLLLNETADSPAYSWYSTCFGETYVEAAEVSNATSYQVSGMLGEWLQNHFSSRQYRFVTAEFGTYDIVRVFAAIREENRAHHYGVVGSANYRAAKAELLECFCPSDSVWQKQVLKSALKIIGRATQALEVEASSVYQYKSINQELENISS